MRQIVIDTETTGLIPEQNHRIIEIGCVELINRELTGNNFHYYLNPEREVEIGSIAIHGITSDFLADKPKFADILDEFLTYVTDAEIIAHNAEFDVGFINYEMRRLKKTKALAEYVTVFDTLQLARKLFPGQKNNLDALCKRLQVDLSSRKLHGALLDASLLAQAYLLMTGGQTSLFNDGDSHAKPSASNKVATHSHHKKRQLPILYATSEEIEAHQKFNKKIEKNSGKKFWEDD